MRYRRDILCGTGLLTTVSIAGCLDNLEDEDQSDKVEPQSSNQPSTTDNSDNSADNSESNNNENDDRESTSKDQSSEEENQVSNRETRKEIYDHYSESIRQTNTGTSRLNDSIEAQSNENYSQAIRSASRAQTSFREAEETISEAIGLTYEISNREARNLCEEGEEYAGYLYDAARMQERSAEAARDGDHQQAIEYLEDAQSYSEDADRVNPRDSRVLRRALDLD